MDNLCHTLVGAAIGEAGLSRRVRHGSAVLMVAANLPDIDVLAFMSETPAVALRRGWTHGVLAQLFLPLLLVGVLLSIDRMRRKPADPEPRARAAPFLLLSYIGVLSHVLLDCLNNYGVRLLMPFSGRWFYGDSVFIVDPWIWAALGAGVYLARRYARPRLAIAALAVAILYITGMVWSAFGAREEVLLAWRNQHGGAPRELMVGPVFVNPLRRAVIVDAGDRYYTGTFTWDERRVVYDDRTTLRGEEHPVVALAREHPDMRAALTWARFPYYDVKPAEQGGWRVTVRDMRFGSRVGQISVLVAAR